MSKTDKTRPWWVQMVDAPGLTCIPVHDHRFGPCTLPTEITAERISIGARRSGCYWDGTADYWCHRLESHGSREWNRFRREERRSNRRQARRELHNYLGED
jgi:hypothetical protein